MSQFITDFLSSSMPASAGGLAGKAGRVRVLLVEGDPSTRASLAALLAKRGFDVESFDAHPAAHERLLDGAPLNGGPIKGGPIKGGALNEVALQAGVLPGGLEIGHRPAPVEKIACGKLLIDLAERRVWWNGVEVTLTTGEFRIVVLLASHADCCIDYRTVYDHLHYKGFRSGYGEKGFWVNVRSVIRRIRARFRAVDGSFEEIQSIRAFGYRWRKPV